MIGVIGSIATILLVGIADFATLLRNTSRRRELEAEILGMLLKHR